jgi:hypothetical protein
MYTRGENAQFIPSGWLCKKCYRPVLQRDGNEIATNKQPDITTTTTTTSDLKDQLAILEREKDEYKELSIKLMSEHPERTFQNASDIPGVTVITTTISGDIQFPANQLANFFKAQTQCKNFMLLKIDGDKVVGWESN